MFILALLTAVQLANGAAAPQQPAPDIFSGTAGLDLLSEDRDSLRGIERVLLTFNVPDELAATLDLDVLRSTMAFKLQQAGIEVIESRSLEDPALVVSIRVVRERIDGRETGRVLYRAYADLLQLVRLPDLRGSARLMLASTWHAGSFGALDTSALDSLRDRVGEVIDTFTADLREVNAQ